MRTRNDLDQHGRRISAAATTLTYFSPRPPGARAEELARDAARRTLAELLDEPERFVLDPTGRWFTSVPRAGRGRSR